MTIVRLDYQRKQKPFPHLGAAVLVVALSGLALAGYRYQTVTAAAQEWQAKVDRIDHLERRQMPTAGLSESEARAMAAEIKQANDTIRLYNVPWDSLFLAVESSASKNVALLTMEPNAEKHVLRITAEAKTVGEALDFMRRLGERKELRNVYLQHHQIQDQDSEKPLQFAVVADWE